MNIIQQFIKSLYSPETIAKFRMQKIGKTILYVFFLMFLVTIPPAIVLGSGISSIYDKAETHLVNTFPDFTIENGVLHADIDEPIIVEDDGEYIIFDPNGELRIDEINDYGNAFALLEREVAFVSGGIHEGISYQDFGITIAKPELVELVENLGGILPLIIGLLIFFIYVFTTGMKFVGIFALSLIGLFLSKRNAPQLSYKNLWVISAYTVTMPTVLFAIIDILQISIPFSFTIYWVIAIMMLYFVFGHINKPRGATHE
ncbi:MULTISPECIES: DUF1189 domain-containing protein [Bacillaceae]|uniref:DUF1189 domain-containing protein n=1 Tax=Evansella alkalicola TaxID=745819 RepID=A0ABS6JVD0_9BACI|nr:MULTISPECIES: DUF1189 domain-containing protein [Bacillaceae]MBU9722448.1 DUF1189 domain-containing protein [Bacillus alkalicola]